MNGPPLLIGNKADRHLQVVRDRLIQNGQQPVVLDADTLGERDYSLSRDRLVVNGVDVASPNRCWLRRIAPNRWTTGELVGSVNDLSFRARVRAIAAIARQPGRDWLSHIDALQIAEDRLYQLTVANQLDIATPRTSITSTPETLRDELGSDLIIKPLATGAFVGNGNQPHTVHTTRLTPEILATGDFAAAPFVVQERIPAVLHLRIVTAGDVAQTASLDASAWPLDWREADDAHTSWEANPHPEIESEALRLGDALSLRYTSQDWLVPNSGPPVFIDLNPAGQWMFLPAEVADPITNFIVDFLSGQT